MPSRSSWFLEPPLIDARQQGPRLDPKKFGCSVGTFDLPIRLCQNAQQVVALADLQFGFCEKLGFFDSAGDRVEAQIRCRRCRRPGLKRQVKIQNSTASQNARALDDVPQFANTLIYGTTEPVSLTDVQHNLSLVREPVAQDVAQSVLSGGQLRVSPYHGQVFTDDLAPVERLIDDIIFGYATGGR